MDYRNRMNATNNSLAPETSQMQEKQELQLLIDRLCDYVAHVRSFSQSGCNTESSSLIDVTKIIDETTNLKNLYEKELESLRKEIEAVGSEKGTLNIKCDEQKKYIRDLQDRLTMEADKNGRLLDEINMLQRRIGNLEAGIKDAHISAQRPQEEVEQLQRSVEYLTGQVDQWRHRYEQEQVKSQLCEDRLQQALRKSDFSEQVHSQQSRDCQSRLDSAAATILNLEAQVRELSCADVSVSGVLKQVQETAEAELRKYQAESEENYSRNLSALKAQIDSDANTIQRFSQEKSKLIENIGDLQAKLWSLQGQIANLQHQKQNLEETMTEERGQRADYIQELERKLRDVQEMLVTKMSEVTSARESSIPLRAEIEALKALLAEEEIRLQTIASTAQIRLSQPLTASDVLRVNSLRSAPNAASSNHLQQNVRSYVHSGTEGESKKTSVTEEIRPLYENTPNYSSNMFNTPDGLYSGAWNSLSFTRQVTDDDLYKHEFQSHDKGHEYRYEGSPSVSRAYAEPLLPLTSPAVGPIQGRARSAPVELKKESTKASTLGDTKPIDRRWDYTPSKFGCGRDFFQDKTRDLQKQALSLKSGSCNSVTESDKIPADFQGYKVPISSGTGDLKISEVNEDGKYIKLVNEGPRELNVGNYILRQNVNGHPVAVFRFPPHVKIQPASTITVWSGMNDPQPHNPSTDFFWQEQETWRTGPGCSTILCRANGQAVAWTTADGRHSTDVAEDFVQPDIYFDAAVKTLSVDADARDDDYDDDEGLTDQNNYLPESKPEQFTLRREKQLSRLPSAKQRHDSAHATLPNSTTKYQQPAQTRNQKQSAPSTQPRDRITLNKIKKPPTLRGNGILIKKQAGSIFLLPQSSYTSTLHKQPVERPREHGGYLFPLAMQG